MIGAYKPTVPLLGGQQIVLSKDFINPAAIVSVKPTAYLLPTKPEKKTTKPIKSVTKTTKTRTGTTRTGSKSVR